MATGRIAILRPFPPPFSSPRPHSSPLPKCFSSFPTRIPIAAHCLTFFAPSSLPGRPSPLFLPTLLLRFRS
ncbi:hypothetical protein OPV22_015018 [Ensete ventricosum]|uniref:Uncharacterized protein n=1 Tax=Ensete ventricosum TaxID=4639 RepID=A0AAV8QZ37_ENSVE|nr:hypothetical protein OPV22_015018 [Ensete ventricosum]